MKKETKTTKEIKTKSVTISVKCCDGDYEQTIEIAKDADTLQQVEAWFAEHGRGGRITMIKE